MRGRPSGWSVPASERGRELPVTPVTFLTGASSGIGWALAPLLAADGHAVALVARRGDALERRAEDIRRAGGKALALACDVTDRAGVRETVERCEAELGPVERLVANAGIGDDTPAEAFDAGLVRRILETNVLGAAHCVEAVLPGMLERRRGHIVGMSSLAALRGFPRAAAYCASKAALSTLLESLRVDLRPYAVDVTIIFPGFVRTVPADQRRHPMPFLLELDDAARRIHRAIRARVPAYFFPWPLAVPARIARFLPPRVYDLLAARLGRP